MSGIVVAAVAAVAFGTLVIAALPLLATAADESVAPPLRNSKVEGRPGATGATGAAGATGTACTACTACTARLRTRD